MTGWEISPEKRNEVENSSTLVAFLTIKCQLPFSLDHDTTTILRLQCCLELGHKRKVLGHLQHQNAGFFVFEESAPTLRQ